MHLGGDPFVFTHAQAECLHAAANEPGTMGSENHTTVESFGGHLLVEVISVCGDKSTHDIAVAPKKFGGTVEGDISPAFEGSLKERSCPGVVDDHEHFGCVFIAPPCEIGDIDCAKEGVSGCFEEDHVRVPWDLGECLIASAKIEDDQVEVALLGLAKTESVGTAVDQGVDDQCSAGGDKTENDQQSGHAGSDGKAMGRALESRNDFFNFKTVRVFLTRVEVGRTRLEGAGLKEGGDDRICALDFAAGAEDPGGW